MKYSGKTISFIISLCLALMMIISSFLTGCSNSSSTTAAAPKTSAAAPQTTASAPQTSAAPLTSAAAVTSSAPAPAAAKPVTLVFSSFNLAKGLISDNLYKPYFDELSKRSNGSIKIEAHWNGELASVMDSYNAAAGGTVDIAEFMPPMSPGRFPLDEIASFATWGANNWKPSRTYYDLLQKFPEMQAEYKDTHLVACALAESEQSRRLYVLTRTLRD